MRIRPARAHEYALDLAPFAQVVGESGFHAGVGVPRDGEVVLRAGRGDEGVDFGEGVRGDDVDAWDLWGERGRVGGEGGEDEDEEH